MNVFTVVILSVLISLLVLSAAQAKGNGNSNPASATNQPNFVPGELLIQFRADATEEDEIRVLGKINGEALEHIRTQPMISAGRGNLVLTHFQPDLPQSAVIKILKEDPAVEFAEPIGFTLTNQLLMTPIIQVVRYGVCMVMMQRHRSMYMAVRRMKPGRQGVREVTPFILV